MTHPLSSRLITHRLAAFAALCCLTALSSCRTGAPTGDDAETSAESPPRPEAESRASERALRGAQALQEGARDLAPTSLEYDNVVLRGATLLTITGGTIKEGDLWIDQGVIQAISSSPIEPLPEGATLLDVSGKVISPGLIDTHSHLGVYPTPSLQAHSDGNEATSPTTPDVDAIHGVWPQDPGFQRALAGGVTALQILPGSANLIGGRTATLQLHPGISSEAMRFKGAPVGLKMACGENPKRVYGRKGSKPSTRMGSMAVWRATFINAEEALEAEARYEAQLSLWEKEGGEEGRRPKAPGRDLSSETLLGVLRGEILVHVHCYRADEMVQVLQLADEFGFKVRSFHHAVEAYKIRDLLAAWDVSVSTWADWWGFKVEAHDAIPQNAALVSEAGARAIIHSDSPYDIQRLNQEAAKALYEAQHVGMATTEEEAMRWITINPAWALGIDSQTGSLEVGKRADLALWSRHPLSVYAVAERVWVEGVLEYDREADPEPWSDFELGASKARVPMVIPKTDKEAP